TFNANLLTITGDPGANQVVITDDGTGAVGNVQAQCDNSGVMSGGAISLIRVITLGGADSVRYNLSKGLQPGVSRQLSVDLGDNDNQFAAFIGGDLGAKSNLRMDVQGGTGNDLLMV